MAMEVQIQLPLQHIHSVDIMIKQVEVGHNILIQVEQVLEHGIKQMMQLCMLNGLEVR